ncbi:hypothetical protein [Chamaesiphon sp. GL140_3_metabinner_50]|uniref:hypothetical protein n=1 Tax=Chamaesiphon sp. GL140_3_metabinner_50 TaxID=2970812 RepID=UPI0025CEE6CE|nr:hypothetical protein [Chamaesiphon sp. GL140_3_metabinner_50]
MAVGTSSVNAQEQSKPYSIGPTIEFSGGGTSFGIKGRISNPGVPVSVRPIVLFGYTPSVSGATFSQAVSNGSGTLSGFASLTTEQKRAQVKLIFDIALTDQQADDVAKRLSAALATAPARRTTEQNFYIAKAQDSVQRYDLENFKTLTPAQQKAQVKLFAPANTTDVQIDAATAALKQAVETPAANRTPAQNQTIANARLSLNNADLSVFSSLTPTQQRETAQIFSRTPLTELEADAFANQLTSALNTSVAIRTPAQNAIITTANQSVAYAANTGAVGFTPGSGVAYGAAITYDFESADKKLMGYFGPRILFASGSSKVGNFDTSTTETSIGALIGADYAISGDFTAGLNATYNFSKSGTLSVSGPGGFSGSAPVSGNSSFDIGVSFGYRF